jgi:hypothetical protein
VVLGGVGGELGAGVALVADDRLAAPQGAGEQPARDAAFSVVGRGEDDRADRAVRRAEQCRRVPQNQSEWLRL